jgi:hypothetical protein
MEGKYEIKNIFGNPNYWFINPNHFWPKFGSSTEIVTAY